MERPCLHGVTAEEVREQAVRLVENAIEEAIAAEDAPDFSKWVVDALVAAGWTPPERRAGLEQP